MQLQTTILRPEITLLNQILIRLIGRFLQARTVYRQPPILQGVGKSRHKKAIEMKIYHRPSQKIFCSEIMCVSSKNPLRQAAKQFENMDRSISTTPIAVIEREVLSCQKSNWIFQTCFGSSKNMIVATDEAPQLPPIGLGGRDEGRNIRPAVNPNQHGSQLPHSLVTLPPEPSAPPAEPPQVLNKKPSFFRRRKKTITEKRQIEFDAFPSHGTSDAAARPSP